MSEKARRIAVAEFHKITVTIDNDWICVAEIQGDAVVITSGITEGLCFSIPMEHLAAWAEMLRRVEACVDGE
jgi:hypothetical protein